MHMGPTFLKIHFQQSLLNVLLCLFWIVYFSDRILLTCNIFSSLEAMIAEVNEMPSGWPLGLDNMNMRLRVMENLQAASADPNSFGVRSASFSSFTSSDLDTESTRSFFQDHSITLGRLIGIRPGEGDLYFTNSIHHPEEHDRVSMMTVRPHSSKQRKTEVPQGICIPLLLCVLVKISPSRNSSRR